MIECCIQCRGNLHVVMDGATGNAFQDLVNLVSGRGRIITMSCTKDSSDFWLRSFHIKYGGLACDFCLIHGIEWHYFHRMNNVEIPRKCWGTMEQWLMAKIPDEPTFRQGECRYYDTIIVEGLNR